MPLLINNYKMRTNTLNIAEYSNLKFSQGSGSASSKLNRGPNGALPPNTIFVCDHPTKSDGYHYQH